MDGYRISMRNQIGGDLDDHLHAKDVVVVQYSQEELTQ